VNSIHQPSSESLRFSLRQFYLPLSALSLALIFLSFLSGTSRFFSIDGIEILPSFGIAFLLFSPLALLSFLAARKTGAICSYELFSSHFFIAFLLLLFISHWFSLPYNFFHSVLIRGEIIFFLLVGLLLLKLNKLKEALSLLLLITPLLLFLNFQTISAGRLLSSDDHASFLYRLIALKEEFPNIPFYQTLWNSGSDARDFFATGALNFFFLFSPFIYLFDLPSSYSILFATLFFILLPLATAFATQLLYKSYFTSLLSATLAVSCSMTLYEWGFKYGTLGFITSLSLFPINFALSYQLIRSPRDFSEKKLIFFAITLTLMLLWSLSVLFLLPFALFGVLKIKELLLTRRIRIFILTLLLINIPWMALFLSVSKVVNFVVKAEVSQTSLATNQIQEQAIKQSKRSPQSPSLVKVLTSIRNSSAPTNPLILAATIPALFLLPKLLSIVFASTLLTLLFFSSFLSKLLPQLELERMFLVAAFLASLPCAFFINHIFTHAKQHVYKFAALLAFSFLSSGILASALVTSNRSLIKYDFAGKNWHQLIKAIHDFSDDNSRILFSGHVLHQVDGSHIAPFVYLTNQALIASSPFHNTWRYTQVFPKSFIKRKNSGGIEEYLKLFNVSLVFSHEADWNRYFNNHPEHYTRIWYNQDFQLFRLTAPPPGWIYLGKAKLDTKAPKNQIKLIAESQEIVVRFNYLPFLTASSCKLGYKEIAQEVKLIKLSDCKIGEEIIIKSASAWSRVGK
jgi:hypothetical protein